MDELPREKLTKLTKILELIKTILRLRRNDDYVLCTFPKNSHTFTCTTFYNRVPHEVGDLTVCGSGDGLTSPWSSYTVHFLAYGHKKDVGCCPKCIVQYKHSTAVQEVLLLKVQ